MEPVCNCGTYGCCFWPPRLFLGLLLGLLLGPVAWACSLGLLLGLLLGLVAWAVVGHRNQSCSNFVELVDTERTRNTKVTIYLVVGSGAVADMKNGGRRYGAENIVHDHMIELLTAVQNLHETSIKAR